MTEEKLSLKSGEELLASILSEHPLSSDDIDVFFNHFHVDSINALYDKLQCVYLSNGGKTAAGAERFAYSFLCLIDDYNKYSDAMDLISAYQHKMYINSYLDIFAKEAANPDAFDAHKELEWIEISENLFWENGLEENEKDAVVSTRKMNICDAFIYIVDHLSIEETNSLLKSLPFGRKEAKCFLDKDPDVRLYHTLLCTFGRDVSNVIMEAVIGSNGSKSEELSEELL